MTTAYRGITRCLSKSNVVSLDSRHYPTSKRLPRDIEKLSTLPLSRHFLYLSYCLCLPPIAWELRVRLVTHERWHAQNGFLSGLLVKLAYDAPMIRSDKLAIQKTGRGRRRHPKSQTVEAHFLRAILIWSSPLSLFQLQLLPSDSLRRKRLSDKDRGEDRGWKRQIRGWRHCICILSTGHRSSVLYRNCEGNRLII